MKKNIALCLIGIVLLVYSLTVREATLLSGSVTVLSAILIAYSLRNKTKRMAKKAFTVPFED